MIPLRDERDSAVVALAFALGHAVSLSTAALGWLRAITGAVLLLFLLGHSFRCIARMLVSSPEPMRLWTSAGVVLDLLVSLAALVAVTAFLMVSFLFQEGILVGFMLAIIAGLNLATLVLGRRNPRPPSTPTTLERSVVRPVVILALFAIAIFAAIRATSPYPSVPGWDLHPTLATVGWSMERHGFVHLLIPPFPSTAVLPYPASFVQLIAGYSLFLGVPPVSIFYYGPVVLLGAYIIGVFGIAHRLTGRVVPSMIAAVALLSLSVANPNTVRTPIFLTIDMVAQLFFLGILGFYLYDEGRVRARRFIVLVAFAFLVYFYYYELIVAFPFIALMLLESSTKDARRTQTRWFTGLLVLITSAVAAGYLALAILAPTSAADLNAPLPLSAKIGILLSIYSLGFVLLFALAAAEYQKSGSKEIRGLGIRHLFLYSAAYLVIYLFPIWATYRVEFYFRWTLAASLAIIPLPAWRDVRTLWTALSRRVKDRPTLTPDDRRSVAHLLVVLLLVGLLLFPIPGSLGTRVATMSVDEHDASMWIRFNTMAGAYVVTDPSTGFVVRGLSLRNASTFFLLPDGRAPADSTILYPNLLASLHRIFAANSTQDAHDRVLALGFGDMYVLISTRTVVWSQEETESLFFWPFEDRDPATLLPVFAAPAFSVVFASPTVFILRVEP